MITPAGALRVTVGNRPAIASSDFPLRADRKTERTASSAATDPHATSSSRFQSRL